MKKAELIQRVADASDQPQTVVRSVLDATRDVVSGAINQGEGVFLLGLGKLEVSERGPKPARNIHTGERVTVPARKVVIFRPSEGVTAAANGHVAPTETTDA